MTAAIRTAIVEGEFAPNQRLVEPDLCAAHHASRAAVRAALQELTFEGLVERTPHRGARVRSLTLHEAVEILEARTALDALCAAKAAERISDPERAELLALRADLLAAAADGRLEQYSALNQRLDRRVREISGHATAGALLARLQARVVRQQFRLAFQPGRAQRSAPQHAAIIDAVVARDPKAAEARTREHLAGVIDALTGPPD
ncbi:FCD domain-containing protein [Kineococcus sp. R8]|nr:GntR family transcriptional regulator [Kineococcus siccus]NAZ82198.1 FCD domain-containing protein [Kineococcus siccus]